jgi:hypothetical protein
MVLSRRNGWFGTLLRFLRALLFQFRFWIQHLAFSLWHFPPPFSVASARSCLNPTCGALPNAATLSFQISVERKRLLPADHADERRFGKRLEEARREIRVPSSFPPFPRFSPVQKFFNLCASA